MLCFLASSPPSMIPNNTLSSMTISPALQSPDFYTIFKHPNSSSHEVASNSRTNPSDTSPGSHSSPPSTCHLACPIFITLCQCNIGLAASYSTTLTGYAYCAKHQPPSYTHRKGEALGLGCVWWDNVMKCLFRSGECDTGLAIQH